MNFENIFYYLRQFSHLYIYWSYSSPSKSLHRFFLSLYKSSLNSLKKQTQVQLNNKHPKPRRNQKKKKNHPKTTGNKKKKNKKTQTTKTPNCNQIKSHTQNTVESIICWANTLGSALEWLIVLLHWRKEIFSLQASIWQFHC